MSYSRNYPCAYCNKKTTCTDSTRIEEGIEKIHQTSYENGHKGSGTIILQCNKMDSNIKC